MKKSDICAHIPPVDTYNILAHKNEINTIADTLDKLNSMIELEARRGYFKVTCSDRLNDAVISALKQIGYFVATDGCGSFTISWEDQYADIYRNRDIESACNEIMYCPGE